MNGNKSVRSRVAASFSNIGGIAVILLIALISIVILSFLLSKQPFNTLHFFFLGPVQNLYYFGNMLNSAIPLMLGGLGISIALKSNNLNLGGEGQIYLGAFVTTICSIYLASLHVFGAVIALMIGAAAAGLIAGFSGVCKMKWNTSELITSFLLSNAIILVVDYLITGPFLNPDTNLLATRKVPEGFQLSKILPPSNLSTALFIALVMTAAVYVYLYRSKDGYELRLFGINEQFAKYGGISTGKNQILPMFWSGALYGLGGGLAIYGTYYACIKGFSEGMGWNGLAVALIAKSKPVAVIPAAIFFAYIESGAKNAMLHSDVTHEISMIVQSVVFFLVTSEVLQRIFQKKENSL
jgi:simple sugar transport system permease protein